MSGGSPRFSEMKRENSRSWSCLVGSTAVTPRQKQTAGIGRRAAALAEDALLARPVDDVVHGEEVVGVVQLGDQRQLLLELVGLTLSGTPLRIAPGRALPGQVASGAGSPVLPGGTGSSGYS